MGILLSIFGVVLGVVLNILFGTSCGSFVPHFDKRTKLLVLLCLWQCFIFIELTSQCAKAYQLKVHPYENKTKTLGANCEELGLSMGRSQQWLAQSHSSWNALCRFRTVWPSSLNIDLTFNKVTITEFNFQEASPTKMLVGWDLSQCIDGLRYLNCSLS